MFTPLAQYAVQLVTEDRLAEAQAAQRRRAAREAREAREARNGGVARVWRGTSAATAAARRRAAAADAS